MHREKCNYKNCANTKGTQPGLSFYRFPKNNKRRSAWVLQCNNTRLLSASDRQLDKLSVCGSHFTADCFMRPGHNLKLVWNAVPTLEEPEVRMARPVDSEALSPDSPLTIAELLPANILASALKGLPPHSSIAKVVRESPPTSCIDNALDGSSPESPPVILVEESPVASPPVFLVEDSPPGSPRGNAPPPSGTRQVLLPSKKDTPRLGRKLNKPARPRVENMAQISRNMNPRSGPCRFCMEVSKTPMTSIFMERAKSETHLVTKIFSVTGIKVIKGDGLPTSICQECNESIDDWFEFKKVCISSDKHFKSARKQRTTEGSSHADTSHESSQLDPVLSKRTNESCQVIIDGQKPVEVNRKSVEHNKPHNTSTHFVDTKKCDGQNIGVASTGADSKHGRANESCKVIIDSKKHVEVKRKSVEQNLFTSSAHLIDTNRYDDQNIEQTPADVEGDSTHETLPPAFVSVKIEPNDRRSMWNPEVSLKYAGDSDDVPSTSELPPVEYEVQFGSDVVCETGEKALKDPLSLPTSDKEIVSSRQETKTPITLQTLRKLLKNTGTKPKSYLLAVKPVSAPSEEPPTYVLAMNPPTSGRHGNIGDKISNLPVIKNVSVPLTSKPDMTKLYDLYHPKRKASSNKYQFTIKVPTAPLKTVPSRTIESNVTKGVASYNRTPCSIKVPTVPLNTTPDITSESNVPRKRSGDPLGKASGTKISKGSPSIS